MSWLDGVPPLALAGYDPNAPPSAWVTTADVAKIAGISPRGVRARKQRGWRAEDLTRGPLVGEHVYPRVRVLVRGRMMSVREIARAFGLARSTIQYRIRRGRTGDALVCPPSDRSRARGVIAVTYRGEPMPLGRAAARAGLTPSTVYWRWRRGVRGDALFARATWRHAPFTAAEKAAIRRAKGTQVEIARRFGCAQTAVSRIRRTR